MVFLAEDGDGVVPALEVGGVGLAGFEEIAADEVGDLGFVFIFRAGCAAFALEGFVDFGEVVGHPAGLGEVEHAVLGFREWSAGA